MGGVELAPAAARAQPAHASGGAGLCVERRRQPGTGRRPPRPGRRPPAPAVRGTLALALRASAVPAGVRALARGRLAPAGRGFAARTGGERPAARTCQLDVAHSVRGVAMERRRGGQGRQASCPFPGDQALGLARRRGSALEAPQDTCPTGTGTECPEPHTCTCSALQVRCRWVLGLRHGEPAAERDPNYARISQRGRAVAVSPKIHLAALIRRGRHGPPAHVG